MKILYSDTEKSTFDPRRAVPYHEQKATINALKHYENLLFLTRITEEPKSFMERMQAEKELVICQRKIDHWRRHPNFSTKDFSEGCLIKKKQWGIV